MIDMDRLCENRRVCKTSGEGSRPPVQTGDLAEQVRRNVAYWRVPPHELRNEEHRHVTTPDGRVWVASCIGPTWVAHTVPGKNRVWVKSTVFDADDFAARLTAAPAPTSTAKESGGCD